MSSSEIKTVGIYGGGTIGGGFAAFFALKGLHVTVCDLYVDFAKGKVQTAVDAYVKYGITDNAEALMTRITFTDDPAKAFTGVDFVQENGPEDPEKKHELIAVLERYLPENAIIASSSTGLPATVVAEGAKHPERIMVAHPFNPSYLIPLIEICKGEKTEDRYVQRAVEFYKSCGKTPIVLKKERPGFVANRLAHALWREEMALVCEGVCTLEDADNAICYGPGLRWGIMGPAMGYELGAGELGLGGMMEKFGASSNGIYADLSTLKATPAEFPELARAQMPELMKNLPDHVGHTHEEAAAFRDQMLVEMLKMHRKL